MDIPGWNVSYDVDRQPAVKTRTTGSVANDNERHFMAGPPVGRETRSEGESVCRTLPDGSKRANESCR